eukprot:TRINITY_DN8916_c0_g1_i1.p2 TRINITY_DN8916_c0_g1~~TRINITY_DN8916_c0_g1_i1.p2  ORF type:complete len:102 (-),score=36.12 TRINITY_DN8916_c0_g1_i1:5-310(-)
MCIRDRYMGNNKIRFDIKKMVEKKEPRSTVRIVAQQILKNNQLVKKYQRLDAQLSGALYQLNSAATTDALVGIMKDVSQICLLYTSPSPRDRQKSRMPSSA